MFDLLPDGTIAIDMTTAEGEPIRVVVNPPPTVGALKRLRVKSNELDAEARAKAAALDTPPEPAEGEDPPPVLTGPERRLAVTEINDANVIDWWKFVLLGDDTWKGLAPDCPPDPDCWPTYMTQIDTIVTAQGHWRQTPLARGGKLVAETS